MPLPRTPRDTLALRKELFDIIQRLSFLRGSFVLSSGRASDYFLDLKPTMLHPQGAVLLAELVLNKLQDVKVHYIGGLAMGAVPLVSQVAMLSHSTGRSIPGFFVRKAVKDHGTQKLIDGVKQGDLERKSVVILEDVTTTGESAMQAIKAAQDAGAKIELVLAIVDREEGAAEFFEKQGIPFKWLFRASELLQATEPNRRNKLARASRAASAISATIRSASLGYCRTAGAYWRSMRTTSMGKSRSLFNPVRISPATCKRSYCFQTALVPICQITRLGASSITSF